MHATEHPDYTHATTLEGITDRTKQVSVYLSISLHLSIVIDIYLVYIYRYRNLAVVYIYKEHPDYTHATTLEGITDRTKQVFNSLHLSTYLYVCIYMYIVYIRFSLYHMHAAEHPDYTHATTLEGITDRTKQVSNSLHLSTYLYICKYIYIVYIYVSLYIICTLRSTRTTHTRRL